MMFRIAPASLAVLAIFNVASTLANGNFKVEYTLEGNGAVISDPRFSYGDGSGCGGSNAKCHCQVPSVGANAGELLMVGQGTSGTATGLDFSCIFFVLKVGSPPGSAVQCSIHVDIPYTGHNELTCECAGYKIRGCTLPHSGHVFNNFIAFEPTVPTAIFPQEIQQEKSTCA